jgi:capsular exopolysaccharide synthesis family protein
MEVARMASTGSAVGQPIVDLQDYLRAIWARRRQVIAVALLVLVAVEVWTFMQTPVYTAQAKLLVLPPQNPSLPAAGVSASQLQPVMTTEAELVRSESVASQVRQSLRPPIPVQVLLKHVKATPLPDSNIMTIAYTSANPSTASNVANAFARAYIDVRTQDRVAGITRALAPIQQEITATKVEIASLNHRIRTAAPGAVQDLKAKRTAALQSLPVLEAKRLDLESEASGNQAGKVVQSAGTPSAPSSPNALVNGALGLIGGLALGLLIALVRDAADKRVRNREELERRVGAPVLASIPKVASWRDSTNPVLVSQAEPNSPASEAYGTLATNLRYGASQILLKVVTVTSSLPGEGKTATAANLAVALAQSGLRVLVVSGDLRRPRIHRFFDLENGDGLTDAVGRSIPLSRFILPTMVADVSLLPSGAQPLNPVAFLARLKASGAFAELRDLCDVVICDAPPILPVADAVILASMSDGVIFVHDPERSNRAAVTESRDRLRVAGGRIVGVVYSNVDVRGQGSYEAGIELEPRRQRRKSNSMSSVPAAER